MKTLGKRIAEYRKLKGLTQENLATKLNVSPQAVSKWENDLSIPDLPILMELTDMFQITMDDLLRPQEKRVETRVVEKPLRKSADEMMLRVVINSSDGDKVKVNLPVMLIKAGLTSNISMPSIGGKDLNNIQFEQLIEMAEKGVIGKLVEIESDDGDIVEVFVE